jgi:hypothetical protein
MYKGGDQVHLSHPMVLSVVDVFISLSLEQIILSLFFLHGTYQQLNSFSFYLNLWE